MLANIIRNAKKYSTTGDPYYSAVSLMLSMDGTNGSTTFTDSGPNAFTLTRYGTAAVSTTQSKYGGASGYFDGSGARLGLSSTAIDFGTGDFTAECWIYLNASPSSANAHIMGKHVYGISASWILQINTSRVLSFLWNDGVNILSTGTALNLSQWYHIAACRSGSTLRVFINGTQVATTTISYTFSSTTEFTVCSASNDNALSRVNAYIDDLRISQFARYVSNFTPPTAALPTTASSTVADPYYNYTSLLLHMDGTNASTNFVDSGPNALAVTAAGNAQISTTQSKYGGASAYFDGTGDYLSASSPDITGSWTVECWWYPSTVTVQQTILSCNSGSSAGINIWCNTSGRMVVDNGVTGQAAFTGGSFTANQWNHITVVRNGTTTTGYINGSAVGSNTFSPISSSFINVGRYAATPFAYLNGYIDDLRITRFARYVSTFTPPTAALPDIYNPYTSLPVTGAALWLAGDDSSTLYTDAGSSAVTKSGDLVYQWSDKSGNGRNATQATSGNRPTWVAPANARNNLGAVGFNASQWINLADNTSLAFGTSDFTVECWIKPTSFSGTSFLLGAATNSFCIYFASTGALNIGQYGVAGLVASSVISTSTWTHIAVSRSGTSLRVFLNGTLTNTLTNSSNFQGSQVTRIGQDPAPSNGNTNYNGQIQNLIIYKGQALYTANFTPFMS